MKIFVSAIYEEGLEANGKLERESEALLETKSLEFAHSRLEPGVVSRY
jgi:hypothetical protein